MTLLRGSVQGLSVKEKVDNTVLRKSVIEEKLQSQPRIYLSFSVLTARFRIGLERQVYQSAC